MKYLLLLLFCTAGCASYQQAQIDLLQQARDGLKLCDQVRQEHRAVADELDQLRRRRLDEAFDADVRENQTLTADWVIEHRRAYAAGLQALVLAHTASLAADETHTRNLKAIDAALERAQWLISIQMQLLQFKGESNDPD